MSLLTFKTSNTCNVNDDSSLSIDFLLRCHDFGSMFRHVESSNNIYFEDLHHLLRGNNSFWWYDHSNWNDTSTVDDSTNFTELFERELKESDDILLAADVSFEKLTSRLLLSQCMTKFFVKICNDYLDTMRSKKTNGSLSETRCTTGDDGN